MPLLRPGRGRRRVASLPDRRRRRRSRIVVVMRGHDVHHRWSSARDGAEAAAATVRDAARERRPPRIAAVERPGPVGQDRHVVVGDTGRNSPSDGGIGQ